MSDLTKINSTHLSRLAYVYLRQSSAAQVEHNRESTARQYALVTKAAELGWPAQQVLVIDEDLGVSGSGIIERSGFARLTAEVALGHVGIVLGLEVSRLARNNADWYRLLDLCGLTDTLIGDADGIYHPAMFNDRLVLGLKGTMSEAELHILRARLLGGIRNKAARDARPQLREGEEWHWIAAFVGLTVGVTAVGRGHEGRIVGRASLRRRPRDAEAEGSDGGEHHRADSGVIEAPQAAILRIAECLAQAP